MWGSLPWQSEVPVNLRGARHELSCMRVGTPAPRGPLRIPLAHEIGLGELFVTLHAGVEPAAAGDLLAVTA